MSASSKHAASSRTRKSALLNAILPVVGVSEQYVWDGVNLREELHRLVEFCPTELRVRPPALLLHTVDGPRKFVGYAHRESWLIEIWTWPSLPLGSVLATLVHELAHFCAPTDRRHGDLFRTAMLELARDAYGVVVPWHEGNRQIMQLDFMLEFQICKHIVRWLDSHAPWPLRNERCAEVPEEAPCKG